MGAIEQHRAKVSRIEEAGVQPFYVSGRVLVVGVGDVFCDVAFPVRFTDRPFLSAGLEMDTDFVPIEGRFPRYGITVATWKRSGETDVFGGYYTGARLAISVSGEWEQQTWAHWTVHGKGIMGTSDPTIVEDG